MTRTAYVSSLRRAFLLRVHPDRFQSSDVRLQQAALVKALAHRMSQSDFTAWLQQRNEPLNELYMDDKTYPFVMEKRDGSLLSSSFSLCQPVDGVLHSMSAALLDSGVAASFLTPPSSPTLDPDELKATTSFPFTANNEPTAGTTWETPTGFSRYNIHSNQGRNLMHLLSDRSLTDGIRERRAARVDAQATALQVRRIYQLAAVDATETGWSSSSVAVLLRRLLALHKEFAGNFHVTSFYPVRLVFSPRDIPDDRHAALDVYGGILRLNPASTSIQWLDALQLVTTERIREIHAHRAMLQQRTKAVQGTLGVKLRKGFTCSSRDYHSFLERLASSQNGESARPHGLVALPSDSLFPMLEPVHAIVEADASCRRPSATRNGCIQLGAGMTETECRDAIRRLSGSAFEKAVADKEAAARCNQAVAAIQWNLGLQRVYRTGFVSHDDFLDSLLRFVALVQGEHDRRPFDCLTGNSLGIAATGHFCHLADDGSVVIPHNWT